MVTWIRFDWKEQPTFEDIARALKPHGLVVRNFENGDEFEFAVCSPDVTDDQIIDSIIDNFDSDETPDELRASLNKLLKPMEENARF